MHYHELPPFGGALGTAYLNRGAPIRLRIVRRRPRPVPLLHPLWGLGYRSWKTGTDGLKKGRWMAQRRLFANTKDSVRIAYSRPKFISRLFAPFAKTQEFGEN